MDLPTIELLSGNMLGKLCMPMRMFNGCTSSAGSFVEGSAHHDSQRPSGTYLNPLMEQSRTSLGWSVSIIKYPASVDYGTTQPREHNHPVRAYQSNNREFNPTLLFYIDPLNCRSWSWLLSVGNFLEKCLKRPSEGSTVRPSHSTIPFLFFQCFIVVNSKSSIPLIRNNAL